MTSFLPEHSEMLAESAVDDLVAIEAGVRSITTPSELPDVLGTWRTHDGIAPGVLFPGAGPEGATTVQYRPDHPVVIEGDERPRKYIFPTGSRPVVNVHPRMVDLLSKATTILVVEGTKQVLAAVSAAPDEVLVVGVSGCQGWRSEGVPLPDWNLLPVNGADVVIAFDADIATNRNVHDAGAALADHLELLGASTVRFLKAPTGQKAGLDDYLASIATGRRKSVLGSLIDRAGPLPKQPAKKRQKAKGDDPAAAFFDQHGLRAVDLVGAVRNGRHHALGPDGSVWTYDPMSGLYCDTEHALIGATRDVLGNRYRGLHHRTMLELLAAALSAEKRRLPEAPVGRRVNFANGALDVSTLTFHDHSPDSMAFAGMQVAWNPEAKCPIFDGWLEDVSGSQALDILEALGVMLTPWCGQRKVPFLIGPTRSAKGTLIRLVEALVATEHRSAVTLHDLSTNRFAPANLHGKILNSAGDLSDRHIEDLSLFKMLTGDDTVPAERKFRDAFDFRNTALFVFSANQPPTVSEGSRAYAARVRPYLFPHSYEGREDPSIEEAMMRELPGIAVRLVEGARRWLDRGGYAVINPIVADVFARQSDPVAMFVAQVLEPDDGNFVTTAALHDAYKDWAIANGRGTLGRNKLLARADNVLGDRTREHSGSRGSQGWRGWRVLPESEWIDDDATYALVSTSIEPGGAAFAAFTPTSPYEGETGKEANGVVVPHEGEIGPKAAKAATAGNDPSAWIEKTF